MFKVGDKVRVKTMPSRVYTIVDYNPHYSNPYRLDTEGGYWYHENGLAPAEDKDTQIAGLKAIIEDATDIILANHLIWTSVPKAASHKEQNRVLREVVHDIFKALNPDGTKG